MAQSKPQELLALDIGTKRIGVARANSLARIPESLGILDNDDSIYANLQQIIDERNPAIIVIGIPRNLSGELTHQSQSILDWTKGFIDRVKTNARVVHSDETLSSVAAREIDPSARHIDDQAACVILDDYMRSNNV